MTRSAILRRLLVASAAAFAVSTYASASGGAHPELPVQDVPADVALVGGRLIDGYEGAPIDDAAVLLRGDRITYAGPLARVRVPSGARIIDTDGMTMMPGLVDLHVHLMVLGHGEYSEWFPRYEGRMREVMAISARQLLAHGVTTARDVGGPLTESLWIREQIQTGKLPGPRLRITGPFITRSTAGLPTYFQRVVASPDEAAAAARDLIKAGVDWLKPWSGMTKADLVAIVREGRAARIPVAAHGLTDAEILDGIEAGVATLEHIGAGSAPLYDPAIVARLAASRVAVVPTAIVSGIYVETEQFPERLDAVELKRDFPADLYADVRRSLDRFETLRYFWTKKRDVVHYSAKLRQLREGGVQILVGTDSGTPMNFHTEATWREMVWLARSGMPPQHVIAAATRLAARALGLGDEVGVLEAGKRADVIVVDGDPLRDMSDMRYVVRVFKDGREFPAARRGAGEAVTDSGGRKLEAASCQLPASSFRLPAGGEEEEAVSVVVPAGMAAERRFLSVIGRQGEMVTRREPLRMCVQEGGRR